VYEHAEHADKDQTKQREHRDAADFDIVEPRKLGNDRHQGHAQRRRSGSLKHDLLAIRHVQIHLDQRPNLDAHQHGEQVKQRKRYARRATGHELDAKDQCEVDDDDSQKSNSRQRIRRNVRSKRGKQKADSRNPHHAAQQGRGVRLDDAAILVCVDSSHGISTSLNRLDAASLPPVANRSPWLHNRTPEYTDTSEPSASRILAGFCLFNPANAGPYSAPKSATISWFSTGYTCQRGCRTSYADVLPVRRFVYPQ